MDGERLCYAKTVARPRDTSVALEKLGCSLHLQRSLRRDLRTGSERSEDEHLDTASDGSARSERNWDEVGTPELRCLTFELSGRRRRDASAWTAKMYRVLPSGRWWPAVGAPLERGVRLQWGCASK